MIFYIKQRDITDIFLNNFIFVKLSILSLRLSFAKNLRRLVFSNQSFKPQEFMSTCLFLLSKGKINLGTVLCMNRLMFAFS